MIDSKVKYNPLICILVSLIIFFCGLYFVKNENFIFYFLSSFFIFLIFGFYRVILKSFPVFLFFALLAYIFTYIGSGYIDAIYSVYRVLVLALAAVTTLSIEPARLVRSFNQLGINSKTSIGLLITLRFMKLVKEEIKRVNGAMKLRSINFVKSPLLWMRSFFIPLLIRVTSISETMATSLEIRGFNADIERSNYEYVGIYIKDIILIVIIIFIQIAFIGGYIVRS